MAEMQGQVIELTAKIVAQERVRNTHMNQKQVKEESEERRDTFDAFADFVNDYYQLKNDLVKAEIEVYDYG